MLSRSAAAWAALAVVVFAGVRPASAAVAPPPVTAADRALAEYFRAQTAALAARCLADVHTGDDWQAQRERRRRELFEMLGLWPLPERSDLRAVVTGRLEQDEFTVEKLHFQSLPGLYVTANLYLPKGRTAPAPAVLYVCGHAPVKRDGVSFGNKVAYQHHGQWLARHGYVCLVLDTLQLGELEGLHHGTYREGLWWWNARGYTPAGVEVWNCLRALDYLGTRPEVDPRRLGMTGRSGGGAYTWFTAALDERVRVAAPVAGITDLQNHVVDGCVEGHCDCMYFVNTHRWDFPLVAALIAPRPLLLLNTDADPLFPLDGVLRLHAKVRRLYELCGASTNLGLVIGPGPHLDTQDLQVPVLRWFNRHLRGEDPLIRDAAEKRFEPEPLRVFTAPPAGALNARVHEVFVPRAAPVPPPDTRAAWETWREDRTRSLRGQCFAGWPEEPEPLAPAEVARAEAGGGRVQVLEFTSQAQVRLPLLVFTATTGPKPQRLRLTVLDEEEWSALASDLAREYPALADRFAPAGTPESAAAPAPQARWRRELAAAPGTVWVALAPRGVGPTAWSGDARKQVHLRRRFMLLGQTLDAMRVWDVVRAAAVLHTVPDRAGLPLTLEGRQGMSGVALYAGLFVPGLEALELTALPVSHEQGPDFLNVLRVLDVPQAVALAAARARVRLRATDPAVAEFARETGRRLGWPADRITVEP